MSKLYGEGEKGFLESELTQLEERFIGQLKRFDRLSQAEKISLAVQTDFFEQLSKLGLSHVVEKMQLEYSDIMTSIEAMKPEGVSPLHYEDLQTLMELDTEALLGQAHSYAAQFQSSMIKGFVAGETTDDVASRLENISLTSNQTIAAITTARDQFHASAMAKAFEDDKEARFILAGPVDNRTRCACRGVMEFQPEEGHTKTEIDKGAWTKLAIKGCHEFGTSPSEKNYVADYLGGNYTFVGRGGYNCRHFVQISEKQYGK